MGFGWKGYRKQSERGREAQISEDAHQRAEDTVVLLRCLVARARRVSRREDVAGVTVIPSKEDAEAAGMVLNSPRYNAARDELLRAGSLERAYITGEHEAFTITRRGIELLRDIEESL